MKRLVVSLILLVSIASASKFNVGDSVTVLSGLSNQYKYDAVVIISGNKQSKVEYTRFCQLRFVDTRNSGDTEWAPNRAIVVR